MPVQRCTKEGQPGYRWGTTGRCYTYRSGDRSSRERAKRRALAQGRAIQARKASTATG